MSWICGVTEAEAGTEVAGAEVAAEAAAPGSPGLATATSCDVRCTGGAGRRGPGRPGRGGATGRGPGTGRGVGAVRPLAVVARGPWALS